MGLRKNVKLFVTICAVSWKSAVCHERNKDRLDKVSRGFQIETPSLSHVPEGAWNATPFWQPKIPPSNDIRSAGILILYGSTIYSVRDILFNGIKPRQDHTAADVFLNYLRYFTLIKSSPISDMRPIGEGLIKRKVFAGAHTIQINSNLEKAHRFA